MPTAVALDGGGKKGPSTAHATFSPPPGEHGTHSPLRKGRGPLCPTCVCHEVSAHPRSLGSKGKGLPSLWGQHHRLLCPHRSLIWVSDQGRPCHRRQHLGPSPRAAQGATCPGSPGSPRQDAQGSSPAGQADPPGVTHPSTSKLSVATPATPETFLLSSRRAPPAPPTRPRPAPPGEDPGARASHGAGQHSATCWTHSMLWAPRVCVCVCYSAY